MQTRDNVNDYLQKHASRSDKFYSALKEEANEVAKLGKSQFLEELEKSFKPKTGRVPGAEVSFIRALQAISQDSANKERSFSDKLREVYPFVNKGGTNMARKRMFELGGDFTFSGGKGCGTSRRKRSASCSISDTDEERNRLDPVAAARGDHDHQYLTSAIEEDLSSQETECARKRRKRAECSRLKLKLVDNSMKLEGDKLSFETIDENGLKQSHEIKVDLSQLSTPKYTREKLAAADLEEVKKTTDPINKGLGVYGAVVNILGAAQYFSKGEYGKGALSAAQATHAIGGLTGINDVISSVTKQAFKKVMSYAVEKVGLEKTLEKLSELGAEALGKTAARVLGRFAEDLPYVGLAFDLYFIAEDIKDLLNKNSSTPQGLKIAHLVLDVTITVLTLVETAAPEAEPFIEPVVIALTIVRISLDDFYYDISDELSKLKSKSFTNILEAVLRGFADGVVDLFTLGLGRQMRQLDKQEAYDNCLLSNLTKPASYFNVTFKAIGTNGSEVGTVDLTAGVLSQFGGFITVKLNDNGTFTVILPDIPTKYGDPITAIKTFSFNEPIADIVLGVGEVSNPEFIEKEAKLWLFIPVKHYELISNFTEHKSSRYGVYYGNNDDNDFFAVQGDRRKKRSIASKMLHHNTNSLSKRELEECEVPDPENETRLYLQSYNYDLYGKGGNDRFFLGPQTSQVSGDEGSDLYHIQPDGGRAIINNFALDEEQDTLYLNVSYTSIFCYRNELDLTILYCGTHSIQLKNWFVLGNEEFHRHLYILAKDGVGIEVTDTVINGRDIGTTCNPVWIDKSRSTEGVEITLTGPFSKVKQVTGSNFTDHITGNDNANTIRGGLGDDYVEGGNGPDIYIINEGDGHDQINNFAADKVDDSLVFTIPYKNIAVRREENNLILSDSRDLAGRQTIVTFQSWYLDSRYQHMQFVSKDYVRFVIGEDNEESPKTISMTIDLGGYTSGVILDLMNINHNRNIQVNQEVMHDTKVILDSPHDDTLKGNILGNFLSCSGGTDFLQGNGGKDTYIIEQSCNSVTINNYDQQRDFDLILLKCNRSSVYLSRSTHGTSPQSLLIQCNTSSHVLQIQLMNWFTSADYQHIYLKTIDKITAFLPESLEELFFTGGQLIPVEIETDEDCGGQSVHYNLSAPINQRVERFVGKTDTCSFNVTGNAQGNYIDPGPGNPYGYQELTGGNGQDYYVIGHNYSIYNIINNYADDNETDQLMFKVIFHNIEASREGNDVVLSSQSRSDFVQVRVVDYFRNSSFQHLLIQSVDNIVFVFVEEYPFIQVQMIDYTTSVFSQVIQADRNDTLLNTRIIVGSMSAQNYIAGGNYTVKITGGNESDTINGGPMDEDLFGLSGNDIITGGEGNDYIFGGQGDDKVNGSSGDDIIYGGFGADIINGGEGHDTIVFSGLNFTGIEIDLTIGLGWSSDAEGDTYISIENIEATEYNDTIIGNHDDNIISGYGGSDYIAPGGGNDILEGGTESDIYDFQNGYGTKVIINFATDEEDDIIVLNKTYSKAVCYFFLDDDLEMNLNLSQNTSDSINRIWLDETYLHIKLLYFLKNSTYQHIVMLFKDKLVYPGNFSTSGRQMSSLFHKVTNETILSVKSQSYSAVTLTFNLSALHQPPSASHYKMEFVHLGYNSTVRHPFTWPMHGRIFYQTISNLQFGFEHKFFVMLISCGLVVGTSPLLSVTIKPSVPINPQIHGIVFDGFTISWTPPLSSTDPLVSIYSYQVIVRNDGLKETVLKFTNSTTFTTYDLLPETEYKVTVASKVYETIGNATKEVKVKTGKNNCKNLVNLPSKMHINGFSRNSAGNIEAQFYCDEGYNLVGASSVICNDVNAVLPTCVPITCPYSIQNAVVTKYIDDSGNTIFLSTPMSIIAYHRNIFTWNCLSGYESNSLLDSFNSTCLLGKWSPPIYSCQKKPSCTGLIAPTHGNVSSQNILVGEKVTFSCSTGYQLNGPIEVFCKRSVKNVAYWTPLHHTVCIKSTCPMLLPQPHGRYLHASTSQYSSGDSVTLICNQGYYIEDAPINPEQHVLTCKLGGLWNPQPKLCQRNIIVTNIIEGVLDVTGMVQYSFSSWSSRVVDSSLYPGACALMGGVSKYTHLQGNTIKCKRQYKLAGGPNNWTGFLSVGTKLGMQKKVCINGVTIAQAVCTHLGYGQYTTSLYTAHAMQTDLITASKTLPTTLKEHSQQCTTGIRCRAQCSNLYLPNGNTCTNTLEGEVCSFQCNVGFWMTGSQSRKCTGTGEWTGIHTFCDGEKMKILIYTYQSYSVYIQVVWYTDKKQS